LQFQYSTPPLRGYKLATYFTGNFIRCLQVDVQFVQMLRGVNVISKDTNLLTIRGLREVITAARQSLCSYSGP